MLQVAGRCVIKGVELRLPEDNCSQVRGASYINTLPQVL